MPKQERCSLMQSCRYASRLEPSSKEGLWGVPNSNDIPNGVVGFVLMGGVIAVPKEFTVFRVVVPASEEERGKGRSEMVFELQGSQTMFRAAERAGRKLKAKPMPDL